MIFFVFLCLDEFIYGLRCVKEFTGVSIDIMRTSSNLRKSNRYFIKFCVAYLLFMADCASYL